MISLRYTDHSFAAAVTIHLFRGRHLLLRPTTRYDIKQDIVLLTPTGAHTIRSAGWWIDPTPDTLLKNTTTITLPVRRAVAALRWVYGCSESPSPETEESEGEEGQDGEYPVEPISVGDDDVQVDQAHEAWERIVARSYEWPSDAECALETVVLDCLKGDASGGGPTEIAGIFPSSVRTVVLRTRPRLERLKEREELLGVLWDTHFPHPPTPSGGDLDSAIYTEGMHWALEHEDDNPNPNQPENDKYMMAFHVPAIAGEFTTLVLSLQGMHPDVMLDTSLVCAPLERIVVVCGLEGRPEGLDESWRSYHRWAARPALRWGVFTPLLERFAGRNVRIDIVDAGRLDGETEVEPISTTEVGAPKTDRSATDAPSGTAATTVGQETNAQAQVAVSNAAPAQDAPPSATPVADVLLGCAYEDLPRTAADEDYGGITSESEAGERRMKILAEIRYLDSRRDVGRGKVISSAEWKRWTDIHATD